MFGASLWKGSILLIFKLLEVVVADSHDNFCRPLEDYGPRTDSMEERNVCNTNFEKSCELVEVEDCMEITELHCELELITNCTMDWTMKESVDTAMRIETKALKNCTKEMVVEFHNKTIYDCQNVTKRHCTTLWTINEQGQKVWAGNEDDCREVTWEECNPLEKTVPMSVAKMICVDMPVTYSEYANATSLHMADTMDCSVEKVPVCEPVTSQKCAATSYTRCEEVPETICSLVEIPVPSQAKLHKQWCLFDQREGDIDFDREVRKITGSAEEAALKTLQNEEAIDTVQQQRRGGRGRAQSFDEAAFISQLTLLDVQAPDKRPLQPIFPDFAMKELARGGQANNLNKRGRKNYKNYNKSNKGNSGKSSKNKSGKHKESPAQRRNKRQGGTTTGRQAKDASKSNGVQK